MARELNGSARPRPLRVAFLIEDDQHAHLALDGIFADCYSRWGGRFSLIVPCVNGRIAASYWPWLEAYDADIIYSYIPLARADVLEVHERLSPAVYAFHALGREPRLDVFGFKPSYDFTPLASLSGIFRMARYSQPVPGEGAVPVRIIDSWHTETPSRFLTDNFGTYHVSQATGMYPADAVSAATLLTIVSPEKRADRRFGVPGDLIAVDNEMAAFREFALRHATSLSITSALFASKLDIRVYPWSESFNLVVGDSFTDRILFWNARLLIPAWLDTDLSCFRVDPAQIKDLEFLAILGDMLKRHNHVNNGTGGQAQVTIRSTSLGEEDLSEVQELIAATKPWSGLRTEKIATLDAIVPSEEAFRHAREASHVSSGLFAKTDWATFIWTPPTARPPHIVPDHLSDAPPRQAFTQGYWCTDFVFECDTPGPRFGKGNYWMLPRRWRMAGSFKTSLTSAQQHALPPPVRRSHDGKLAVCICADHSLESITVPTSYEAMRYALVRDGAWAEAGAEHGGIQPPSKAVWMQPSNEARYLTGMLGMAGGLELASQFLLHPFLMDIFSKLGATPSLTADDVSPTVSRLQKRAKREAAFDLRQEGERQALADLIIKAAGSLRNPLHFIYYDDLKGAWKKYREAYWAKHPQDGDADNGVDWEKHEEESLDDCLIELRRRQIIFQGDRWTCPRCHHRNWIDFGSLSAELSCEVCKQVKQAPVDIRWRFRPNEFLIESLRHHSVLSLIWALSALRARARRSFVFIEPTWFGFTPESEDPDAEADLLVLLDGKAVLCEVKASWHTLRPPHVTDFVALALRLRPDIALLAVMEKQSGPWANLDSAKSTLAQEGIVFELLTPDMYQIDDDPYLSSGD